MLPVATNVACLCLSELCK